MDDLVETIYRCKVCGMMEDFNYDVIKNHSKTPLTGPVFNKGDSYHLTYINGLYLAIVESEIKPNREHNRRYHFLVLENTGDKLLDTDAAMFLENELKKPAFRDSRLRLIDHVYMQRLVEDIIPASYDGIIDEITRILPIQELAPGKLM